MFHVMCYAGVWSQLCLLLWDGGIKFMRTIIGNFWMAAKSNGITCIIL